MNPTDIRMECLRLAAKPGEHHEAVVTAAKAYAAFVTGDKANCDDNPGAIESAFVGAVLPDV